MVARVGRVILCPNEQRELQYAWGLGITANNQAEYLALWQGLELDIARKIHRLMVFGDSMIVIQQITKLKEKCSVYSPPVMQRISLWLKNFKIIEFYHVKRHLNLVAGPQIS